MDYVGEHLLPGKIGHFFSVLSLAASLVAFIAYFKATNAKTPEEEKSWRKMARIAFGIDVLAVFSVLFTIIYVVTHRLFEYNFAWEHSSMALPMNYLLACIWEAQEGSFLLWTIWLCILGAILIKKAGKWEAPVMTVMSFALFCVATMILGSVLALMEFAVPVFAERKDGGTPWHAGHIAERYSLFVLIGLGEGIVGTVAALSAAVAQQGWTLGAGLVGIAGTGLTFGMWWIYFLVPSAQLLREHRDRVFVWAAAQMIVVIAVVATGAGLHVAAYFIEHNARISLLATVLSVAVPVGVLGMLYAGYRFSVWAREQDWPAPP